MPAVKYRHELKHFINYSDYLQIKNRLKFITSLDNFADKKTGRYKIRSLYFDNIYDKVLLEKINGVDNREKFRIRLYNDDSSFIRLEKKTKKNGLCQKLNAIITKEQCALIISGSLGWIKETDNPLLMEFYCKSKYQLLKPATIVDYTREAYLYKVGNVRITFDMNVRSGLYSKNIFDKDLPVADPISDNSIILEVKYDEFLPEIISNVIQTNNKQATAISKYASCRIYG
ncbi:polyphosphate polymerase domain-containing protein [Clostridium vincentii]|uniref:VTC domain protein n=1 Tax=Clostridium vincentii TaxID=52704 RepID=A0A2T0BID1_9CLOT|nr:polyphosphate polymerase domain-containing protein [Clostridium vincentii]PRR83562.1 VTC domain protein [Clostridium vincentii]